MTNFQHKLERIMRGENIVSNEEHTAVDKMFCRHVYADMDSELYDEMAKESTERIKQYVTDYAIGKRYNYDERKLRSLLRHLYERDFKPARINKINWEESIATGSLVMVGKKSIEEETDPKKIMNYVKSWNQYNRQDKVKKGLKRLKEIGYKWVKTRNNKEHTIDWNKSMIAETLIYENQTESLIDDEISKLEQEIQRLKQLRKSI